MNAKYFVMPVSQFEYISRHMMQHGVYSITVCIHFAIQYMYTSVTVL